MDNQCKWQPIETAPKDGTHVLLWPSPYWGGDSLSGGYATAHKRWFADGSGSETISPTHWQPLPPPPKEAA